MVRDAYPSQNDTVLPQGLGSAYDEASKRTIQQMFNQSWELLQSVWQLRSFQ
mgnify:CR=1 FL=1